MDFLTKARNIIWLGGTGRGKTGLASSFLRHAIEAGATGRYVLFADLVAELYQSVAVHTQEQVLKKYWRWDVLLIDEIGYVEVEPVQVGLFFTLMQKRHRNKPTLLTSNLGFSEWGAFLKNDHLTAATSAEVPVGELGPRERERAAGGVPLVGIETVGLGVGAA